MHFYLGLLKVAVGTRWGWTPGNYRACACPLFPSTDRQAVTVSSPSSGLEVAQKPAPPSTLVNGSDAGENCCALS